MSDSDLIVLGLDPGFASFGWAVQRVDALTGAERLEGLGVIRTKKATGKVLVRDDDHARAAEMARGLIEVTRRWRPHVICAEALSHVNPSGPARMPVSTMTKMGRVWGLVDMLCEVYEVGLLQASPQTIKKATAGKASATKGEVLDALDARFGGRVRELLRSIKATTQHEHPVDALGAIVALEHHDHMRIARANRAAWAGRPAGPVQGALAV